MEHSYLDEHSGKNSFIHRLEPRIKIISLFLYILFIILSPPNSFMAFLLYGLIIFILIVFSKLSFIFVFKRSLAIFPFLLAVAIFIPFIRGEKIVAEFSFLGFRLSASLEGLLIFCNILIKSYLSILCMILLIATTSFSSLLKAFEKLKFPALFIMIISFMYRYIFVLEDELMKMRMAKESRSIGGSRWFHLKALANMVGILFIRAYERAERVYLAMCSRGFDGEVKTIYDFKIERKDSCFLLSIITALTLIRILAS